MQNAVKVAEGRQERVIVADEGDIVAHEVEFKLQTAGEGEFSLAVFDVDFILCIELVAADAKVHMHEKPIVKKHILLHLQINIVNISPDAIVTLVEFVKHIIAIDLQLPASAELVGILDFPRPAEGYTQRIGADGVVIKRILCQQLHRQDK